MTEDTTEKVEFDSFLKKAREFKEDLKGFRAKMLDL